MCPQLLRQVGHVIEASQTAMMQRRKHLPSAIGWLPQSFSEADQFCLS
jgi:hypothetical protein